MLLGLCPKSSLPSRGLKTKARAVEVCRSVADVAREEVTAVGGLKKVARVMNFHVLAMLEMDNQTSLRRTRLLEQVAKTSLFAVFERKTRSSA